VRKGRKDRDKWTLFISKLKEAYTTGEWFPYTVRLKFKNDKLYAFISFEDGLEKENFEITEESGVVGFDLNVSDGQKIAWAEVSKNGNLLSYGSIKMSELTDRNLTAKERENILWLKAHEIINLALKKRKAIALENLSGIKKGFFRGDGRAKLRRKLAKWSVKNLIEKVEILARREGIKVIKVFPSFTSIIGEIKYCPQFLIDRDTAAAYCIGRKALGFKEKIPKNYLKILNDEEKLAFALEKIEKKETELKEKIRKEGNKYKKRKLKSLTAKRF
jgi:IS605 OrfB family transposase